MARNTLASTTTWITAAAHRQGDELTEVVAGRLGISQRSARALLSRLVAAQWLQRGGSVRRPVWRPGTLRQVVQRYPLAGLQEDRPWACDFAPFFELSANVARLAEHAFTELLNNAIDHSGGSSVTVSMRQTALHLQLLVSDDGCGLFERIQQTFQIDSPTLAMFDLAKGKLTSQPARHRGHGLFFTSRLADVFDLHANQSAFQCRSWDRRHWASGRPMSQQGTSVYLGIALDTARTIDDVLREHSVDHHGLAFQSTSVPLALMTGAQGGLESRALAKRAAARLDSFQAAELDFSGITHVGHAFADELFRVFARQHPGLALQPVGMAPGVAEMIESVRLAA